MDSPVPYLPALTRAERRCLLAIARHRIEAVLRGDRPAPFQGLTPTLTAAGAAFVTLRHGSALRGCIGSITADAPLHETVARVACSAAFDDPRFPPVTAAELPDLEIEISRLSALVPVPAEAVVPGLHGVAIVCRGRRAVFLPKVATTQGWDRETLLRELCEKAALDPQAWRSAEAEVSVFTAEVFADHDEEGAGTGKS